jgi:predicted HAD superfamily Cof-like phosphohydrolase
MKQPDSLNQVAEFHRTFQHPIISDPGIPSKVRCNLRIALIQEELDELRAAVEKKDIVEIADALCDIQYVLSGAVLEFGLGEKFAELFDEVQRSNMSKSCNSEEEAILTVKDYQENKNTKCYYRKVGEKYLIYREGDNKTLKSINYSPADLRSIISQD